MTVKLAMKRNTSLAIVFHLLRRFSPTTRTVLCKVLLLRNDHPHKATLAALNLVVFHIVRLLVFNDTSKQTIEPERHMAGLAVTVLGDVQNHFATLILTIRV